MSPPDQPICRPSAPFEPHGIALLKHGSVNVLVCSLVAVWLTILEQGRFWHSLTYSLTIGMSCWLALDGGRLLLARRLARHRPDQAHYAQGWPGWGWMSLIILLGVPVAYTCGALLADLLTGHTSAMPWRDGWTDYRRGWGSYLFLLMLSFMVAAVIAGFAYARNALLAIRAEAEAARRSAVETQLKLIESQLEPHMLFNTLANLRVLIGIDPSRAQAMLDRLIAFLRATLSASRAGMHPLEAEFERIGDYLALMGIRMGERLGSTLDLPQELRSHPVPPLLLQPLVENSIKHGLEPKVDGGHVEVRARADGSNLILTIRDTGVGLPAIGTTAPTAGTSFGLGQVQERLATLYGPAARLTLQAADDAEGGTLVRIELPLQPTQTTQT